MRLMGLTGAVLTRNNALVTGRAEAASRLSRLHREDSAGHARADGSFFAISLVAAFFLLAVACGSKSPESSEPSGKQVSAALSATATVGLESEPSSAVAATETATSTPTPSTESVSESGDDTPVLVNTPGPVSVLAPDFTLPSIQGPEYTLSEYRGKQPVLVVFYRAYW